MKLRILDDIKGFAVLIIILFHMTLFKGGFLAFDLFILISGYLLMTKLMTDFEYGRIINLRQVIHSNLTKILLPMVLFIFIGLVFNRLIVTSWFFQTSNQGISSLFFVGNWYNALTSTSYWTIPNGIFNGLWIISLLLQLNIIFTFIILYLINDGRRYTKKITKALILIVVTLCFYNLSMSRFSDSRVFYGTDFRALPFAVGILISYLTRVYNLRNKFVYSSYSTITNWCILLLTISCYILVSPTLFNLNKLSVLSTVLHGMLVTIAIITGKNLFKSLRVNRPLELLSKYSLMLIMFIPVVLGIILQIESKTLIINIITILILLLIILAVLKNKVNFCNSKIIIGCILCSVLINLFWIPVDAKLKSHNVEIYKQYNSEMIILVVGDYWGRLIGNSLIEDTANENISVINGAHYDFNLLSTKYTVGAKNDINYLQQWETLIEEHKPSHVIISLGGSDQLKQKVFGEEHQIGNEEFDYIYIKTFIEIVKFFREHKLKVLVTLPPDNGMEDDTEERQDSVNILSEAMRRNITKVISEFDSSYRFYFYDIDILTSPNSRINKYKSEQGERLFKSDRLPTTRLTDIIAEDILKLLKD